MTLVTRVALVAAAFGSVGAGPRTRQQAFQTYESGAFAPGTDVSLVWSSGSLTGVSGHQGRMVFHVPTSAGTATVTASRGGLCAGPITVDVSIQHTWGHFIPLELVPCG